MRYICKSCGCIFGMPWHYRECMDPAIPYWEEWDGCPECGESNYESD